jgi:VanZ family protein
MVFIISWFEKYPVISWLITIIIALAIFMISSLTFPPSPYALDWKPLVYHFFAFFFLGIFLMISLVKGKKIKFTFIVLGIIIAVAYCISDEIHQIFVPGRACTLPDILTDSAGILFASLIYCRHCVRKNHPLTAT